MDRLACFLCQFVVAARRIELTVTITLAPQVILTVVSQGLLGVLFLGDWQLPTRRAHAYVVHYDALEDLYVRRMHRVLSSKLCAKSKGALVPACTFDGLQAMPLLNGGSPSAFQLRYVYFLRSNGFGALGA